MVNYQKPHIQKAANLQTWFGGNFGKEEIFGSLGGNFRLAADEQVVHFVKSSLRKTKNQKQYKFKLIKRLNFNIPCKLQIFPQA